MNKTITTDIVKRVARLSRLQLTEEEVEAFTSQLSDVLNYIELLNEVETDNIEPMAHAVESTNVFREDKLKASLPRSDSLSNAPKTDGNYFLVPPILNQD